MTFFCPLLHASSCIKPGPVGGIRANHRGGGLHRAGQHAGCHLSVPVLPQRRTAADSMHTDDDEYLEEDASGWETASDEDDRAADARGHEDARTSEVSI